MHILSMYIHTYHNMYVCMCIYIYICVNTHNTNRERERQIERDWAPCKAPQNICVPPLCVGAWLLRLDARLNSR